MSNGGYHGGSTILRFGRWSTNDPAEGSIGGTAIKKRAQKEHKKRFLSKDKVRISYLHSSLESHIRGQPMPRIKVPNEWLRQEIADSGGWKSWLSLQPNYQSIAKKKARKLQKRNSNNFASPPPPPKVAECPQCSDPAVLFRRRRKIENSIAKALQQIDIWQAELRNLPQVIKPL